MSTFTVVIELDNDAFMPNVEPELSRLLVLLAHRIERYGVAGPHKIRDGNGNTVGTATTK
jgi:hypothetical protein